MKGDLREMAERVHKSGEAKTDEVQEIDTQKVGETAIKGEIIKADIDDLLDEIDTVLEHDAEEFVKNYIQKGGQ